MYYFCHGKTRNTEKMNIGTKSFWTREYRRQIAKMIGVCYRYVSVRETAEDLAHDAFLKAIEKADTFRGFGSFDKWLMRITVNTALEYLRKKPQTDLNLNIDNLESMVDDQETECSAEDFMSAIRKADFSQKEILEAIAQLPDHHRVVLNLYVFEHLSHNEIAKLLNIAPSTSKSHLMRARKKLQIILFNKSKEKKRTLMVLFPLFIAPECAIDSYCRQQLTRFTIAPQHPLSEADFPAATYNPLPPRLKLRAWRVPLIAGTTTLATSAILVPFLTAPKEPVTIPTPAPAPIAIDSNMLNHPDCQEEETGILKPISAESTPRQRTHRQTAEPIAPTTTQVDADTLVETGKKVVVKKLVRKKHQTVVIEKN